MLAALVLALTLDDAVRMGVERHPSLARARASAAVAAGRVDEARAAWRPQVSAEFDYQRTTANFAPRPGTLPAQFIPGGGATWDTFNFYTAAATATQLVWDFGRTSGRVSSARWSLAAEEAAAVEALLDVVLGVRAAYFDAEARSALVGVARESLENTARHAREVEAYVLIGTRPEIDLAQARTDEANALVSLVDAENTAAQALATLDVAMGRDPAGAYELVPGAMPPLEQEEGDALVLAGEALASRPVMRRARALFEAERANLYAAGGEYLPSIALQTTFNDVGPSFEQLTWNWYALASFKVPIYQGGATRARVAQAQAQSEVAAADSEATRRQLLLDVEQARLSVRAGKASLEAARTALVNARERLRLAEGRYAAGAGSVLELGDAQVALTQAAAQAVQSEYTLSTSRAQLARALGRP